MFINLIDIDLQDRIANSKNYDFDVKNALEMLLEKGPNTLQHDLEDWKLEEHNGKNVMFYKGKNYIPNDLDLRWDIVKMFHDHETAGHLLGDLTTALETRQVERATAVKPLKLRDTVVNHSCLELGRGKVS